MNALKVAVSSLEFQLMSAILFPVYWELIGKRTCAYGGLYEMWGFPSRDYENNKVPRASQMQRDASSFSFTRKCTKG